MKYKKGANIGIYTILEERGRKQRPNRKEGLTDLFFWVICNRCKNEKELSRNALRIKDNVPPFYCFQCSKEQRLQGRQEKKEYIDEMKRNKGKLKDEDKRLYRIALFGRKA